MVAAGHSDKPLNYDLSRLNVLMVDDFQPMRHILRGILKEFGVRRAWEASDGARAMETLKTTPMDLVITDYRMEPVDGITLTKMIRQGIDGVDPFLPILLITAYTEVKNILAARDAGVTEFLAKPFTAKLVYYRLRGVIENPRPFVRASEFFGPDRRRRSVGEYAGPDRRAAGARGDGAERKDQKPVADRKGQLAGAGVDRPGR